LSLSLAAHVVDVKIQNSDGFEGRISVGLFEKGPQFLKTPLYGVVTTPNRDGVRVQFPTVPTGDYCLSAYHDKNANGKLDFIFFFPSERTAFSRNYRPMGPPAFEGCAIRIDGDKVYTLRLE
jgi:uncharacterized protein (DUF2141 family)